VRLQEIAQDRAEGPFDLRRARARSRARGPREVGVEHEQRRSGGEALELLERQVEPPLRRARLDRERPVELTRELREHLLEREPRLRPARRGARDRFDERRAAHAGGGRLARHGHRGREADVPVVVRERQGEAPAALRVAVDRGATQALEVLLAGVPGDPALRERSFGGRVGAQARDPCVHVARDALREHEREDEEPHRASLSACASRRRMEPSRADRHVPEAPDRQPR
jgi:hypothetical protein